jgi:hypothetical protein
MAPKPSAFKFYYDEQAPVLEKPAMRATRPSGLAPGSALGSLASVALSSAQVNIRITENR